MIDMTLGQKQRKFTRMIAQLIEHAYSNDYHANLLVCTCCMQDTIDAVSEVIIEQPNNPVEVFA